MEGAGKCAEVTGRWKPSSGRHGIPACSTWIKMMRTMTHERRGTATVLFSLDIVLQAVDVDLERCFVFAQSAQQYRLRFKEIYSKVSERIYPTPKLRLTIVW